MGNLSSKRNAVQQVVNPVSVAVVGLYGSGKSTVLKHIGKTNGVAVRQSSGLGGTSEKLSLNAFEMDTIEIGGRGSNRFRQVLELGEAHGVVFVLDSSSETRLRYGTYELRTILGYTKHDSSGAKEKPVLVLCNKQDKSGAKSSKDEELSGLLAKVFPDDHNKTPWLAVDCIARKGVGINEGMAWLTGSIEAIRRGGDVSNAQQEDESVPDLNHGIKPKVSDPGQDLGYDPADNQTLDRFAPIQEGSNCPFAKTARLWASPNAEDKASVEDQARKATPALAEFVRRCDKGENLDGFCVELDDPAARDGGPAELGGCVRRFLTTLSDEKDAANGQMIAAPFANRKNWRFQFAGSDFFVTTFAPCYPSTSSRFAFGVSRAFVLLQPESSFARHKLPNDTPETNWNEPKTVRDKTRKAFKDAGRTYHIPATSAYPMAEHIVKPLKDDGRNAVRWWLESSDKEDDAFSSSNKDMPPHMHKAINVEAS